MKKFDLYDSIASCLYNIFVVLLCSFIVSLNVYLVFAIHFFVLFSSENAQSWKKELFVFTRMIQQKE